MTNFSQPEPVLDNPIPVTEAGPPASESCAPPEAAAGVETAVQEPVPPPDPAMAAGLDRVVQRLDRRARRRKAAAMREASFDWLADGFTHQEIAKARKASVAEVRRDIAKAIRGRQAETREGHAQLQIARLTRALALAAERVKRGDMTAIGPLVKVVTALDRYQGGAAQPKSGRIRAPGGAPAPRLPAPPLALAHAPLAADAEPAEPARREAPVGAEASNDPEAV